VDLKRYAEEYFLDVSIEDRVAVLRINRPDKKNAINHAVHVGLDHAFRELGYSREVGAIVLTGAGSAFSSGGDLVDFYPPDHQPREGLRNRDLCWGLIHCEAPIIAAVNGPALGLGATIALLSDVIFMAESAKIGDTHARWGLTAGDGGQVIWPMLVGVHRAKEYLMSAKLLSGPEAERIGLVNHCVPDDELMPRALEYARELAHGSQGAIRWTKMAINKVLYERMNLQLEFGLATEFMASSTGETAEAMKRFAAKQERATD
jgi:enoyl-CoA hydratase/carnithine racemase